MREFTSGKEKRIVQGSSGDSTRVGEVQILLPDSLSKSPLHAYWFVFLGTELWNRTPIF